MTRLARRRRSSLCGSRSGCCRATLRDRYGDEMRQTFERCATLPQARHGARAVGMTRRLDDARRRCVRHARHLSRIAGRSPARRHPVGSLTHDIRYAAAPAPSPAWVHDRRGPDARARHRRQHRRLHRRQRRAAAAAAVPRTRSARPAVPRPQRPAVDDASRRRTIATSRPESGVFAGRGRDHAVVGESHRQRRAPALDGANVTSHVLQRPRRRRRSAAARSSRRTARGRTRRSSSSATGCGAGSSAARPDIVGSTIRLDGKPFTVIGVAPPDLTIPAGAEYWRPLMFSQRQPERQAARRPMDRRDRAPEARRDARTGERRDGDRRPAPVASSIPIPTRTAS